MKKIAIFASLISLMGLAQADVTVYGKVREYQESYTLGTASSLTRLTNDTSRLGVKASQDVGSGMTVGGVIETGVAMDAPSATTLGDRTALFTLSNKLGTIGAGRDKHAIVRTLENFDAMEGLYANIVTTIHSAQGSRVQNAVFVTTAPIMGFTGSYQMANSETAGTSNTQAGSIGYTLGPVSATIARYADSVSSYSTITGVKYTLDKTGTTLYGMYSDDTVSNVSTSGKSVGVRQAVTDQVALMGSYGEKTDGSTGKAVGVAYAMNKALSFHARYSFIDTTTDVTQYGVGVEFTF
jgi:predicted porin